MEMEKSNEATKMKDASFFENAVATPGSFGPVYDAPIYIATALDLVPG